MQKPLLIAGISLNFILLAAICVFLFIDPQNRNASNTDAPDIEEAFDLDDFRNAVIDQSQQINMLKDAIIDLSNTIGEIEKKQSSKRMIFIIHADGTTRQVEEEQLSGPEKKLLDQAAENTEADGFEKKQGDSQPILTDAPSDETLNQIETKSAESVTGGEEGFEPLFDEFNTTHPGGWIIQGLEKAGPKIEPGGVLKVGGWDYWAVISKKSFSNFILRFDARFDPKGNSGVLIHTPNKDIFKRKDRVEIQLDAKFGEPLTNKSNGAIERYAKPLSDPRGPIGSWDAYEIRYQDGRVWVKVNGVVIQDGVNLYNIEALTGRSDAGHIAIQRNDYKKSVYFKNLRIKRLPD
ncbi:MAG: DUF1080 domain-containing protein [Candidatus Hinthialibacter antarcticus]|nr:DUF1080 domain-containing protein [Candidatus Hinthialibacter antarcticus]